MDLPKQEVAEALRDDFERVSSDHRTWAIRSTKANDRFKIRVIGQEVGGALILASVQGKKVQAGVRF